MPWTIAIAVCFLVNLASAAEHPNVENLVTDVATSLRSLAHHERMSILGQIGFETRHLNHIQWQPLRVVFEETARSFTATELIHADEALRRWAPDVAIEVYQHIENVDQRDGVYARLALSIPHDLRMQPTSDLVDEALRRISSTDKRHQTSEARRRSFSLSVPAQQSTPDDVLQKLSVDPQLAVAEFSNNYFPGIPLVDVISNTEIPLPEAQGYVKELFRIADTLEDVRCRDNVLFAVSYARREGLEIPNLSERISSLQLHDLSPFQLLSVFPLLDHDKQRSALRRVLEYSHRIPDTRGYGGGKRAQRGLESVTPEQLGVESSIPLSQKQSYFRHLLGACKTPYDKYRLSRQIAKFDVYWALTISWDLRHELVKQERPYDDSVAAYGRLGWPDEPIGWLALFLGIAWSDWQGYPTQADHAQLVEAIDRFLPSLESSDDREAFLLYRCGAKVSLRDSTAAMDTAERLTLPKYRALAFARIIRMLSSPGA